MTLQVAVLGATGGQGSAVVRALRRAGYRVRAVVRDPHSPRARALAAGRVDVTAGNLADASSLAAAFAGMDAAFAVTTPFEEGPQAEVQQGRAIVQAAVESQLPHLVLASVASADQSTGIPHFESKHQIEELLVREGPPATVVAPTYFFDNLLGDLQTVASGLLELPLPPERPLQQLARDDLGALVAAVIADRPGHLGRRIEVASDDPTPLQMATTLEQLFGRPVQAVEVPLSLVRESNADMGAMWSYLQGPGYRVDIPALHRSYPDIPWTTFADWASTVAKELSPE
ncbi:NmrA family NAD(P)-binding protein [Streptomyces sp. KR55]|uniref:NmrA family NAD(P)-binding protein n=1 Tax=Streptomyces sp. KR55 TaxID=3457425 RepID=UPI003FD4B447